jgi:hypothetical protein
MSRLSEDLKGSAAGYVVSYVQASREWKRKEAPGKRVCAKKHGSCPEGQGPGLLEGAQEFEERLLFGGLQLFEFIGDMFCFAAMAEDGVEKSD